MGNISSGSDGRRHETHRDHPSSSPPTHPHPQQFVFAASTPYPTHYPNPNITPPPQTQPPSQYYQYQGYYPPFPSPYHHPNHYGANHHQSNWTPYGTMLPPAAPPVPYVEHQKAVTVRNDINLKKETFRLVPDEENPGKFLVSFTFDATVSGSITLMFFAREGEDCNLIPTKEDRFPSLTVKFPKGAGQKFKQPSGTGIDFLVLSETELLEASETDVFHVAIKAEAELNIDLNSSEDNPEAKTPNCQITHAAFEKNKGEHKARVIKQILWVNGKRYVLQEIYGIGNAVDDNGADGNQTEKDCVICLSEPRDTTVLPCRHMCMCSGCAKLLRLQTNRCPICRQPVEKFLEITVNTDGANQ